MPALKGLLQIPQLQLFHLQLNYLDFLKVQRVALQLDAEFTSYQQL